MSKTIQLTARFAVQKVLLSFSLDRVFTETSRTKCIAWVLVSIFNIFDRLLCHLTQSHCEQRNQIVPLYTTTLGCIVLLWISKVLISMWNSEYTIYARYNKAQLECFWLHSITNVVCDCLQFEFSWAFLHIFMLMHFHSIHMRWMCLKIEYYVIVLMMQLHLLNSSHSRSSMSHCK